MKYISTMFWDEYCCHAFLKAFPTGLLKLFFFLGNIVVSLAKAPVIEPYSKKVLRLQMLGITSDKVPPQIFL